MRGHLFENMIVAETIKHRANVGKSVDVMFYRDSNGNEIDLLVPEGSSFEAYEIKSSATYNSVFEKGFRNLPENLDSNIVRRAVVYNGVEERRNAPIEVLNYSSVLS